MGPVTPSPPADPALADLLRRIDEAPDELHGDVTPAVNGLIALGRSALASVLDMMASPRSNTRLHAQRAFEGILMREQGFAPGQGFTTPDGEDRFRALWSTQGGYAWDAPATPRAQALVAWRTWLAANGGRGP